MSKDDQIMRVKTALASLNPCRLEIKDESDKHQGHAGYQEGILTHVHIIISSDSFDKRSRLDKHRMVMTTLAAEMNDFLHAVRVTIIGC